MATKNLIDHFAFYVKDIKKTRAFYEPLLALLGAEPKYDYEEQGYVGYVRAGTTNQFGFAYDPTKPVGMNHVAFTADNRELVQRFYNLALSLGGEDNGKPGIREHYAPDYYAAFVLDPDGNNVEVTTRSSV
ncbi:glyoxalase/bleomycin resistance protein/dioxygenase [Lipomyces kononenkoae]